ncbi:MAG: hypothetical protein LAO51_03625 [Acidobacteriia bacterium]|nr:hypothetical protein [Terriglobia bacterium]
MHPSRDTARGEALLARHEQLCFTRAFPRNAAELERALRELQGFERRARPFRDELENTGIAGSVYRYPYNHRMARWLAARYGPAVEIDWAAYKRHRWDDLAAMLSLCTAWAESEGLDDDDVPSWDWVERARRGSRKTALRWILDALARRPLGEPLASHLYESANLPLVWDLAGCRDSVTHARLPVRRVFYHRALIRERPDDFAAAVRQPARPLTRLAPARALRIIDAARAALSQREREFHVIVHGNPEEVYRFDAGRGLEIYVIGLWRPLRLTLEADYGALLVKNGVPVGYGYAALLFDRADIAINIFPTYRAGESPHAFVGFAALFHHHFGQRKLVMRRYQLGFRNPEGIEAGSFWFYYKLGFRPVDAAVRAEAEAEAARLRRRPGTRSGPATLRRLARSDLLLSLDGTPAERFREVEVKRVGLAVTRMIERRFAGDRGRALAALARKVGGLLGIPQARAEALRMTPVAALVPDLARWPVEDRKRLAAVLKAKEARREIEYVRAMRRAPRFERFLAGLR